MKILQLYLTMRTFSYKFYLGMKPGFTTKWNEQEIKGQRSRKQQRNSQQSEREEDLIGLVYAKKIHRNNKWLLENNHLKPGVRKKRNLSHNQKIILLYEHITSRPGNNQWIWFWGITTTVADDMLFLINWSGKNNCLSEWNKQTDTWLFYQNKSIRNICWIVATEDIQIIFSIFCILMFL